MRVCETEANINLVVQLEERFELPNTTILKQGKRRISSGVIEGTLQYKVCLVLNFILKVKVAEYMILGIGIVPISTTSL